MRLYSGFSRWRAITAICMTAAATAIAIVFAVMAAVIANHD